MYKTLSILSDQAYQELKVRYDFYRAEWKRILGDKNCADIEEQKLLPEPLTHEQISQLEVYDFVYNPPHKYFAYVAMTERSVTYTQTHTYKVPTHVTTWTGEILGRITDYNLYKSGFGDYRMSIRVTGINGKHYYGTFYKSAGGYCRLTMCKNG